MFGFVENVAKAAVAVVATPVAVVLDTVTLIPDSVNGDQPFARTGKMIDAVGDNLEKAVDSDK